MKRCNKCGRQHSALDWPTLAYVGEQDDAQGGVLELRNCQCGSTLSLSPEQHAALSAHCQPC